MIASRSEYGVEKACGGCRENVAEAIIEQKASLPSIVLFAKELRIYSTTLGISSTFSSHSIRVWSASEEWSPAGDLAWKPIFWPTYLVSRESEDSLVSSRLVLRMIL